jgi:hypothetical protein
MAIKSYGSTGFLLSGRGGVGIADAGEHSGGVPHWA